MLKLLPIWEHFVGKNIKELIQLNIEHVTDDKFNFKLSSKSLVFVESSKVTKKEFDEECKEELILQLETYFKVKFDFIEDLNISLSDSYTLNGPIFEFDANTKKAALLLSSSKNILQELKHFETLCSWQNKDGGFWNQKEAHFDFEYLDFNYNSESRLELYNRAQETTCDSWVLKNGKIFYFDKISNYYIFWTPLVGTIIHNTTNKSIIIGMNSIEKISDRFLDTKRVEEKTKYIFQRTTELQTLDTIKKVLKEHKADRMFNQYCIVYWIDKEFDILFSHQFEDKTFFDEITQMNVKFENYRCVLSDPKVRIGNYGFETSLGIHEWIKRHNIDLHVISIFPDGEYTDYPTQKKFTVKNGKVVSSEPEKKYSVLADFESSPDCFKRTYLTTMKHLLSICVCLKSKRAYTLDPDDNKIVYRNLESGFQFTDSITNFVHTV